MDVDQNTRLILSGQFGEQAKFICQYIKCDLVSLQSVVTSDYDDCFNVFIQNARELLVGLKRSSQPVSESIDLSINDAEAAQVNLDVVETDTKKGLIKNKKMEKYVERWKTPLVNRTNCIVKKTVYASPVVAGNQVTSDMGARKKRSAFTANISILNDESDETSDEIESENCVKVKLFEKKKIIANSDRSDSDEVVAKGGEQLNKNPSKKARLIDGALVSTKKVKKSKKTKVEDVDMEINNEEAVETVESTLKSSKKGKTKKKKAVKSSKKTNSDEPVDIEADQSDEPVLVETGSKKGLKKVKKSKKIATQEPEEEKESAELVSNATLQVKKSIKPSNLYAKTPSRINNPKTPSTLRISQSILRKSIRHSISKANGRPLTRRAAAEAAAKKTKITSSNVGYTNEAVLIKPMNPVVNALKNAEFGSARNSPIKKLIGKFESISKTPSGTPVKKKDLDSGTPKILGRIKAKDPIEQRKQISSQAKLDAKRKSTKKAQQFLASNVSSKNSSASNSPTETNKIESAPPETSQKIPSSPPTEYPSAKVPSPLSAHSASDEDLSNEINVIPASPPPSNLEPKQKKSTTPPRKKSSDIFVNTTTDEEQKMVDEILNSGGGKVRVSRIPVGLMPLNFQPVRVSSANAFLLEQQRRLTKDFTQPSKIAVNTISYNFLAKTTPSKAATGPSYTSLTGTNAKGNNFAKFLERNTPSKTTRTEAEEKRKAELLAKENKEKERLLEQKRMKHEKQEESKKKREEKLKKIQEVKQKQELEREEKRKELERQALNTLVPSAPKITTSTSHTSIHKAGFLNSSILNKKPFADQSTKAPPVTSSLTCQISKKLSAVDQEAISAFASHFGKYKQLQQQVCTDTEAVISKPEKDTNKYIDEYESSSLTKQLMNHHQNLETTYVLQSPPNPCLKPANSNQSLLKSIQKPSHTNYDVTPLQAPKLKDINNYDVSNLGSEDDTDDDEEPSKPIPDWAVQNRLIIKVKQQNHSMVNFTRLFKSASQAEINLGEIFKTKRKKFTERSSSANWTCPPVWNGLGITGEESFRILKE